jgi:ribonucleotide reductase beta subunit family protein with ferritin-like domain
MTKKLKRLTQEEAFKAMMNRELVYMVDSTKDFIEDLDDNYAQFKGEDYIHAVGIDCVFCEHHCDWLSAYKEVEEK